MFRIIVLLFLFSMENDNRRLKDNFYVLGMFFLCISGDCYDDVFEYWERIRVILKWNLYYVFVKCYVLLEVII